MMLPSWMGPACADGLIYDAQLPPAVLIMAAGNGSRLWPVSVPDRAKQFVALLREDETMLQATWRRAALLTEAANIFVTVAPGMQAWAQAQCPLLVATNVLTLPAGCDTLAGTAYASAVVEARLPGRVLALLAADNFVDDEEKFVSSCQQMLLAAVQPGHLVSLGIEPTYPAANYGYMHVGAPTLVARDAYWGLGYIEKPPLALAEKLVAAGQHLWNSGIFAWRPDNFFAALLGVEPGLAEAVDLLRAAAHASNLQAAAAATRLLPDTSLDHGLMEKLAAPQGASEAQHIFVRGRFAWDDVGSYAALKAHLPHTAQGNAQRGIVSATDCHNCLLFNLSSTPLHVEGLVDHVVVVGEQGDLLVAAWAAVDQLRHRGSWPLHAGTTAFGSTPTQASKDAHGNSSDAPVAFANAQGCHVSGFARAKPRNVVLLGVRNLQVQGAAGEAYEVRPLTPAANEIGMARLGPFAGRLLSLALFAGANDVAEAVAKQIVEDLHRALGQTLRPAVVFSAGATPGEVYRLLATRYRNALPWPRIRLLQMDAYAGLPPDDPAHFHHMLQASLVGPLGLSARWLRGDESAEQMQHYAQDIVAAGGIDLVLHGIGRNGHLGFNEPGAAADAPSTRVALAPQTRADFARAQPHAPAVPSHGVTLGLHVLNAAKRVRVMALGEAKQAALVAGLTAAPSSAWPLSSLQNHPDVLFFADRAAWLPSW